MTLIRQQQRRGTAAAWASANPVLAAGEIGFITDLSPSFKIGDGTTAWNDLPESAISLSELNDVLAGAEAARDAAVQAAADASDISAISTSDAVVQALVVGTADAGQTTRDALIQAQAAAKNPLQRMRLCKDRPFIAAHYGMSISSFGPAPQAMLESMLQQTHGRGSYFFTRGGNFSGSFEAALGWDKQFYGGVGVLRARGKNTSTPLSFTFYGDTYVIPFSRETDSEAAPVLVDGVQVGLTPAAGAQVYNQQITGSVPLGQHIITINPPAGAGYVYWEYVLAYDSTEPGVIFLDFTVGGTSMRNMRVTGTGATVPGQPITNDNGLKGCYQRTDFDLIVNGHDVNDAGAGTPEADADVQDIIRQITAYTLASKTPVLHVSSMAGHYALTADPAKHAYDAIKRAYNREATQWGHVAHFDWDGLTRMPQAKIDDGTYAATYYVPGDFIHPDPNSLALSAYMTGSIALAAQLNLVPPSRSDMFALRIDTYRHMERPARPRSTRGRGPTLIWHSFDTLTLVGGSPLIWRFARPHGLAVGDTIVVDHVPSDSGNLNDNTVLRNRYSVNAPWYVTSVTSPTELTVSETSGGATVNNGGSGSGPERIYRVVPPIQVPLAPAGYGSVQYAPGGGPVTVPYYNDPRAVNGARTYQARIDASSTSDQYGRYLAEGALVVQAEATPYGMPTTLCLRVRIGNAFSVTIYTNSIGLDRDGNRPPTGVGFPTNGSFHQLGSVPTDLEPVVLITHVYGDNFAPPVVYIQQNQSRVYGAFWVPGLLPIMGNR